MSTPLPLPDQLRARWQAVLDSLAEYDRITVAFSGGVDSAVVLLAATLVCKDVTAYTAVSDSLADGELAVCAEIAERLGVRWEPIRTSEMQNPNYRQNRPDRCYHCKTELYTRLVETLPAHGATVLLNGANADDRGDHRPGMQAASEFDVRSPLLDAGLTKDNVRAVARAYELPVWDKPATPCLSSRIAYGTEVTPERLRMIDQAEAWLRERLSLRELRVRLLAGEIAKIEVPKEVLPQVTTEPVRSELSETLRNLGFSAVTIDPEGFRSGSLNESLSPSELVTLDTSSMPNVTE